MIQGGCPLGTGTGGPGYTFGQAPRARLRQALPARDGQRRPGHQRLPVLHHRGRHDVAELQAHDLRRGRRPGPRATSSTRSPAPRRVRATGRSTRSSSSRSRSSAADRLPEPPDPPRVTNPPVPRPGACLLPAPRPGVAHPLPALRPSDLPGLHARRRRRLPLPRVRRRGQAHHAQRPDDVRRAAADERRDHVPGDHRRQRDRLAGDPAHRRGRQPAAGPPGAEAEGLLRPRQQV